VNEHEAEDFRPNDRSLPVIDASSRAEDVSFGAAVNPQLDDHPFNASLESFDWQWDTALNLDSSLFIEDLQIYGHDFDALGAARLPVYSPPGIGQFWTQDQRLPAQGNRGPETFDPVVPNEMNMPESTSGTPSSGVDESSRGMLSMSLEQRVPKTTLPSTAFLNRCIYMYTTRVWPIVPVIHLPTFTPARTHPLLLLVICAIGALADGSDTAYSHAVRMFEGVRKAILVSFSPDSASHDDTFAVLQGGVIGQTCAILSGRPEHLRIARSFHGAMSVMAQEFGSAPPLPITTSSSEDRGPNSPAEMKSSWQRWIREQTLARLHNALQIHNGELATITNQPAQTRSHAAQIPTAEPDKMFLAKSETEWSRLRANVSGTNRSTVAIFSACAELEQIIAEIGHHRFSQPGSVVIQKRQEIEASLVRWLEQRRDSFPNERAQRLSPMMLWHSCFLMLDCDAGLIQQYFNAPTRDRDLLPQNESTSSTSVSLRQWAKTSASINATRHALLITRNVEHLRISEPPALHIARCIWQAGLVLTTYSVFGPEQSDCSPDRVSDDIQCTGLLCARQAGLIGDYDWMVVSHPLSREQCRTTAYSLCTALRSLGPWGNAAWLAKRLTKVLEVAEAQLARRYS
jgi:hypothetical protein